VDVRSLVSGIYGWTNTIAQLVDLLNAASNASKHTASPAQDLEVLEQAIAGVSDMIDRVLAYVKQVCMKLGSTAISDF
jgi:hypothetical protein